MRVAAKPIDRAELHQKSGELKFPKEALINNQDARLRGHDE